MESDTRHSKLETCSAPESWSTFWRGSGVLAAALTLVAVIIGGMPPAPDASVDAVVRYLVENRAALLCGAALACVAFALFVCFFAALWGTLADAEGGRAPLSTAGFGGVLLLFAVGEVGFVLQTAVVWRGAQSFTPDVVRLAYDVNVFALYPMTATFSMLSVVPLTLVAWRTGVLPRWLHVVALVLVAANLSELVGLGFRSGFMAAGAGPGLFAPPAWFVWAGGASWHLWRHHPS